MEYGPGDQRPWSQLPRWVLGHPLPSHGAVTTAALAPGGVLHTVPKDPGGSHTPCAKSPGKIPGDYMGVCGFAFTNIPVPERTDIKY